MSDTTAREFVQAHIAASQLPERDAAKDALLKEKIKQRLAENNAVLVAHYYTDPVLQELAEETGGCVSDSLEMARFGRDHPADTLVVAGVKFMGETAKILTPNKTVLMPDLEATCSLDIGCPADEFSKFCDRYPDRKVVVYANTSAAVKARADWVVTSSCAVEIVNHLTAQGEKLIWAPDKHLGSYIQSNSEADMILWDGACIVHDEFKAKGILDLKKVYPEAAVLVHPESPASVVELADAVGSTSQLIAAAQTLPHNQMIVATDQGIFYKMQQLAPTKELIIAPTAGTSATCRSCANCPWMALNSLESVLSVLESKSNEIHVDLGLAKRAMEPLDRMLDFYATMKR